MNFKWNKVPDAGWELSTGDPGEYHIAQIYPTDEDGVFEIGWWTTTNDGDEAMKETTFTGTLEEAKAFAAALARMGVME
jgi:hypothetical protein